MIEEEIQIKETKPEEARTEEFNFSGDEIVAKVKALIHQGNIRRLSLQTENGKRLIELPLTIGIAGATAVVLLAPVFAAIGAVAAIVARLKVKIERIEEVK